NSTGLTDAQIDALLTFTARNGNLVSDPTNKLLLVRQVGVWTRSLVQGSAAGGDLTGVYPNPTIGTGKVTSAHILDGTITDADVVVRTDLNGSPLFAYSTENGWEQQPRMGAVTVPAASLRRVGTQALPTFADTAIAFTVKDVDTNAIADLAANATRATIKTPGRYRVVGSVGLLSAGIGTGGFLALRLNGSTLARLVDCTTSARGQSVQGEIN